VREAPALERARALRCTRSLASICILARSCAAPPQHVHHSASLFPARARSMIFRIHTGRMSLAPDVDLEEFVMARDELSGADAKAICTEAGMLALRERRMRVTQEDFRKAREKALYRKKSKEPVGLYL
jgi:hypothetical protein